MNRFCMVGERNKQALKSKTEIPYNVILRGREKGVIPFQLSAVLRLKPWK